MSMIVVHGSGTLYCPKLILKTDVCKIMPRKILDIQTRIIIKISFKLKINILLCGPECINKGRTNDTFPLLNGTMLSGNVGGAYFSLTRPSGVGQSSSRDIHHLVC